MLVDVYDVAVEPGASDKPQRQFDWFVHANCDTVEPAAATKVSTTKPPVKNPLAAPFEPLGRGPGYEHLTSPTVWSTQSGTCWDFMTADKKLRMWCQGDEPEEPLTARGIGYSIDQKTPTVVRRRRDAKQARFLTVYDLTGTGEFVTGVEVGPAEKSKGGEPISVVIHTSTGPQTIRFEAPAESAPAQK